MRKFRVVVDPSDARLDGVPKQQSDGLRCLFLCQVGYGGEGWIPEPVAIEFINEHFVLLFGPTKNKPWWIFRFYMQDSITANFLEVRT